VKREPCPLCPTGKLATRTSRRKGSFVQRERECNNGDCPYWDTVLVRPAEVIQVIEVRESGCEHTSTPEVTNQI